MEREGEREEKRLVVTVAYLLFTLTGWAQRVQGP